MHSEIHENISKKGKASDDLKEIDSFGRKVVTLIPGLFLILSAIIAFKAISYQSLNAGRDLVSNFEDRIVGLKHSLPPRGTIGYFNDSEPDSINWEEYWLTQYALSPLIVAKNIDNEWVVGILHSSGLAGNRYEDLGLLLIRDYGNGIVLLRRGRK